MYNFLLSSGHAFTYDMFRDQCLCDNVLIDNGTYGVLRRRYIETNKEGKDASLKIITEAVEAIQPATAPLQPSNAVASAPKPVWSKPNFDNIPDTLKALPNWVCWRAEPPPPGKDKWRKIPYTPLEFIHDDSGKRTSPHPADTTKKATWRSFDQAVQAYRSSQVWHTAAAPPPPKHRNRCRTNINRHH